MIDPPLNDADKAKLLGLLAQHGLSDTEPYAAANELKKGRTTTATRPKPFSPTEIWGKLSPAELGAVLKLPISTLIAQSLGQQDRDAVTQYTAALLATGEISQNTYSEIVKVLTATEEYQAPAPSLFEAEFPGYSYAIVLDTEHESSSGGPVKDEQGNPIIFHEVQHCSTATAALIEEARS